MQGQGDTTEFKQRGFQRTLEKNLWAVCANPTKYVSRFTYFHLDLNCGGGWNSRSQCIGSPLTAVRALASQGKKNYTAWFCDHNQEAVKQLVRVSEIADDQRCFIIHGDNHEVLKNFGLYIASKDKPMYAMGTVLCDPNGCFYDNAVPIKELHEFSQRFPRIDLILNLNVRINRLIRGHVRENNGQWQAYIDIPDLPAYLNRNHWLIREPLQKKGNPFVMLIGRNMHMGDDQPFGLYHLDSADGQRIMNRIREDSCVIQPTNNTALNLCLDFSEP